MFMKVKVKVLSRVQLLENHKLYESWNSQASTGEQLSLFQSLPDPEINLRPALQMDFLQAELPGKGVEVT